MQYEKLIEHLYRASAKFLLPITVRDTYSLIIQEACDFAAAKYGTIFLRQDGDLKRVYTSVPSTFQIEPRDSGYTYKAYKSRQLIIVPRSDFIKFHPELNKRIKSVIIVPLSNRGRTIGVLSLLSTKQKSNRDKRLRLLELLGSVASLAIRKAQLYDGINAALEARDLFISTAAHELKTPLTSIIVYNQLIQNQIKKGFLPDIRWTEELSKQMFRLTNLINDFLQLDKLKVDELKFHWSRCYLRDLVASAKQNFKLRYPDRSLTFYNGIKKRKDVIRGDPDKLVQVLNNVLDNAVKFSPPEKPIKLRAKSNDKYFEISIADEGKGIASKDVPHLFKKYYKGEGRSKPGMGIGLFLSKKILEKHRGDIKIDSQLNKGTTVEILLPKLS